MAGRCSLMPLGGFGGPCHDYENTDEHLRWHCTALLVLLAYWVNTVVSLEVSLKQAAQQTRGLSLQGCCPGSVVFGLFPKLCEQAWSFASSEIAGLVLAYSYGELAYLGQTRTTRNLGSWSPHPFLALPPQVKWGLEARNSLGEIPACFPEYPKCCSSLGWSRF